MSRKVSFLLWWFLIFSFASPSTLYANSSQPRDVAAAFLDAWNTQDYITMYQHVHPNSQEQYPQPIFEAQYTIVAEKILLTGVSYTINTVRLQGDTAIITYDVTLDSNNFSEIVDPGRVMRLVNTPNGWKVAWSTFDIFDMMVNANQLRVQSRPRARAPIYDRDGQVIAYDSGVTVALYSQRQRMNNDVDCYLLLGQIMRESTSYLQRRFNENMPETIFFLGEMPLEIYQQHERALYDICGVGQTNADVFNSTPHRTYYGGNAMIHVAGYIGQVTAEEESLYGAGALIGRTGIERAYQDTLAGVSENVLRITEPGGIVLRELAGTTGTQPTPVMLTIDRDIQLATVQALSDAFNYAMPNWGAPGISTGGAAVVLDVNTGAILAMASYPMFNPSLFNPASMTPDRGTILSNRVVNNQAKPLSNRAIQEQYSPGSVFKIVTLAAALNEGLVGQDDIYYCDLYWEGQAFGDTIPKRSDWRVMDDMDAAGNVTPALALTASCNPFFWEYGARLFREVGGGVVLQYARLLGMGQTYNLNSGWPEVAGSMQTPTGVDIAINEAVGQGDISVPPIQFALLTAVIANGGTVYRPYLVQQVGGMDGTPISQTFEPTVLNTLDFNPGVMEIIQEGMCGVINDEELGTAWGRFHNWGPKGYVDITATYTACGKTGTAQTERYPNAWFVAYAPAENPEIAVVVMVDQSREGSQVSAPIARRILDDYFGAPRAAYPWWWNNEEYNPLQTPEGGGVG